MEGSIGIYLLNNKLNNNIPNWLLLPDCWFMLGKEEEITLILVITEAFHHPISQSIWCMLGEGEKEESPLMSLVMTDTFHYPISQLIWSMLMFEENSTSCVSEQ